ncbi:MAG: hypothetical protein P1V20_23805 [Verrucomicrobiales bacterium]|nr:hypothetical protein [Verrucomicrobiales bacterium]
MPSLSRAELPVAEMTRDKPVDFATEIYPFLKANCLACHNNTKAKANLILESPDDMLKGGDLGPAIEPGNADVSLIFTTAAHIEDPTMPPANNKSKAKNLNPNQLALLKQWVNEGAKGGRVMTEAPRDWQLLSRNQPILASAISGRGRFAAVARGQYIDIYDLPRNKLVATLRDPELKHPVAHRDRVQSLAFSPDGNQLASGGFRIAKVWKRAEHTSSLFCETAAEISVTRLSSDRKWIATGLANGAVNVYRANTPEKPVFQYSTHKGKVIDLAFSPDQKNLYSVAADKKLYRYSLSEKEGEPASVDIEAAAVAVIKQGKHIALASGKKLHLYTADLQPVAEHSLRAPVAALRSGPELLSVYANGEIDLLKLDPADFAKAPQKVRTFIHGSPVIDLAVNQTSLATVGKTGAVKVWNLNDGKLRYQLNRDGESDWHFKDLGQQENIVRRLEAHWKKVGPVEETLSGAEATKSAEAAAEIAAARRDLAAKKLALKSVGPNENETAENAIEEATRLLDRLIRGRDTAARLAGEALSRKLAAESATAEAAALATALKAEKEALLKEQSAQTSAFAATSLDFSPDGSIITVALKDGGLRCREAETGTWLEDVDASSASSIHYLTNRDVISITSTTKLVKLSLPGDQWVLAHSIGDGSAPEPFSGHVAAITFDPDGAHLIAASGIPSRSGELLLFDAKTYTQLEKNDEAHRDSIYAVDCSPDGKYIVSGGADRIVKTFERNTLRNAQSFEGHSDHILDVAWTSDNLYIVSGGADSEVKYWNLAANQVERSQTNYKNEVVAVSIAPGTDGLLTATGEGKLAFANQPLTGAKATFLHTAEFAKSGEVFITGGQDSVLRVWDGRARKLSREYPAPDAGK